MGKLAATLRSLGPGLLVTAAFIGPGTIVTSSRAGARYGFALLWAVVFSVIATAVLQEMAARLGIVRRSGLSDAIRQSFRRPLLRYAALGLVALAITVGNAAYEAGNLLGASLGLELTLGWTPRAWVVVIAVAATVLLGSGTYRVIQSVLVALVVVMSAVFLFTAVMVGPAPGELLKGMLVPQIPAGSLVTIIALIGTTVVPYNLFLHASAVQEKWSSEVPADEALPAARLDTYLSVTLGGAVTLAIIVTATPLLGRGIEQADALMVTGVLEPILGSAAKTFFGLGLFAAGLTSAITAPLAAAYATTGALGMDRDMRSTAFRSVWILVIVVGVALSLSGGSPTEAILLAQAANGLLLPLIAIFLLVVMNDRSLLGRYRNRWFANLLAGAVVLVVIGLGAFQLLRVSGVV